MGYKTLITTTINVPYGLATWRRAGFADHDIFIVAGDQKSPHDAIERFLATLPGDNRYLRPEAQEHWRSSAAIGWNCIQRRNIALLEAIKATDGHGWIITVDDDNIPLDMAHAALVEDYFTGSNDNYLNGRSQTGWWNPGTLLQSGCEDPDGNEVPLIVRGFPLDQRHKHHFLSTWQDRREIGVVASLWLGDPDIDAMDRIVNAPIVGTVPIQYNIALDIGTWAPFNSQATAYRTHLAPLMAVWPGVGRYDDIWASYLARAVMDSIGQHVLYGAPLVHQTRNEHDLLIDLEKEMYGYHLTPRLCQVLREAQPRSLEEAIGALSHNNLKLPVETIHFFNAWLEDLAWIGVGV